jgi:ethanolamine kinase
MQFIDFEYGAYAPRGYDWGNHLNEYAGFECDYARYPDAPHVSLFVRAYLAESATTLPVRAAHCWRPVCCGTCCWVSQQSEPAAQTDEDVEAAAAEANFFALVSHQYWGVWALIQARHSPIDFDYFTYSKLRWSEYHRRKEEFLGAVQPFLQAAR